MRSGAALYLGDDVGVMINEEDHLRLQALRSGFNLADAFADMQRIDEELGERVPLRSTMNSGYLTSCPTNTGTGLRASALIHLPGSC